MSETSACTLERVELDVDFDKPVPCSGEGHNTGHDRHLHGDPSLPAEWMINHRCPACGHAQTRPVCDFFKNNGMHPDRMVTCTACKHKDSAALFFKVLHRL